MTEQFYLRKYLELGFSPIHLRGKIAKYPWKAFTLTEANMGHYINRGLNWGIRAGLLPSGLYLYFVDLDSKDPFASVYKDMPREVPIVSTGRGFHFYLAWREPVKT